jgi:uncharacterized protein (TIGR02453 family)
LITGLYYARPVSFTGIPTAALDFYEDLEADNSKAFWTAHKHVYDEQVKAPLEALAAALEPEFGAPKFFRPYRDVRFSKDKSPYKTQIAAVFERGGYVKLSAEGLGAGAGRYRFSPDQLKRYRDAVADDRRGGALAALLDRLRADGVDVSSHDVLARVPAGYPKDSPRADLLRYKDLVAWRDWPVAAWLGTPKAKDRLEEFFRTCTPLTDWLAAHVR